MRRLLGLSFFCLLLSCSPAQTAQTVTISIGAGKAICTVLDQTLQDEPGIVKAICTLIESLPSGEVRKTTFILRMAATDVPKPTTASPGASSSASAASRK